jgi:adenosylcobinamide-GDP ribazoletransferase
MKQLALAFQFLTIIPITVKGDVSARDLSRSAIFFPVVGVIQGLLAACTAWLAVVIFSEEIASGLVIAVLVISNGGFHLDGLADTFDALAVKSSGHAAKDIEKRLSIMKDSATGAIGVVSVVLVILLKFLFIKELLIHAAAPLAFCLLFLMPVYSKWTMVPALCHGRPARENGLGKIFIDSARASTVISSFLLVTLSYFLVLALSNAAHGKETLALFLSLSGSLYLFSLVAVRFCEGNFGGLTGDNLGAIGEISEILFLTVTTLWLRLFI